jgi:hypothetical protein
MTTGTATSARATPHATPAQAHKANRNRQHGLPVTRIWSRRWYDDADAGTVVHLGNQHADYFDGHEWRTVSKRELAL